MWTAFSYCCVRLHKSNTPFQLNSCFWLFYSGLGCLILTILREARSVGFREYMLNEVFYCFNSSRSFKIVFVRRDLGYTQLFWNGCWHVCTTYREHFRFEFYGGTRTFLLVLYSQIVKENIVRKPSCRKASKVLRHRVKCTKAVSLNCTLIHTALIRMNFWHTRKQQ